MDSNSSSYLVLAATFLFVSILFFFGVGLKRKAFFGQKPAKFNDPDRSRSPLEIRTTHYSQLLLLLVLSTLLIIPVCVFPGASTPAFFVMMLSLATVLLTWFISSQHSTEVDHDDD